MRIGGRDHAAGETARFGVVANQVVATTQHGRSAAGVAGGDEVADGAGAALAAADVDQRGRGRATAGAGVIAAVALVAEDENVAAILRGGVATEGDKGGRQAAVAGEDGPAHAPARSVARSAGGRRSE